MQGVPETHFYALRPTTWFIVFRTDCPYRWVRILSAGAFNHVACFGYVPDAETWVFVDPCAGGLSVALVPEDVHDVLLAKFIEGHTVVAMPAFAHGGFRFRGPLCCTSTVAHIIGVPSCALRPDRLYRDCLALGGTVVSEDVRRTGTGARSRAGGAAEGCGSQPDRVLEGSAVVGDGSAHSDLWGARFLGGRIGAAAYNRLLTWRKSATSPTSDAPPASMTSPTLT